MWGDPHNASLIRTSPPEPQRARSKTLQGRARGDSDSPEEPTASSVRSRPHGAAPLQAALWLLLSTRGTDAIISSRKTIGPNRRLSHRDAEASLALLYPITST